MTVLVTMLNNQIDELRGERDRARSLAARLEAEIAQRALVAATARVVLQSAAPCTCNTPVACVRCTTLSILYAMPDSPADEDARDDMIASRVKP